jgi:large subunit ribosomal protein L17e
LCSLTEGEVLVPPHLYGELAKTEDGCKLIHASGHFTQFVKMLTAPPTQVTLLKRRACIWAIGHIGASETGFRFLDEHNVLPQLVHLAENSSSFSIRGYHSIATL